MTTKYRIFCTEPGDIGWKEVWSSTPPIECPNNNLHTINSNSIQNLENSKEIFRVNSLSISTKNNSFTRIAKLFYSKSFDTVRLVKGIVYKTGSMDSFDIQIFNITENKEILLCSGLTNINEEISIDLGEISTSNAPTMDSIIEINVKRNGGSKKDEVFINEIVFMT